MKYIDAEKVISEIQRLHDAHSGEHGCGEVGLNLEYLGDFITTLLSKQEQPDVELEKACDAYCKVCGHYPHTTPTYICRRACDYFNEFKSLLNARKEE